MTPTPSDHPLVPSSETEARNSEAVLVEGNEDHTIRHRPLRASYKKHPEPPVTGPLRPEELTGIIVLVEGNEDNTIRPRTRRSPEPEK
jgi:hypothetical protein